MLVFEVKLPILLCSTLDILLQSAMAIEPTELRFVGIPTSITFQHLARHGPLKTMAWS